ISIIDQPREVIGLVLKTLGYSYNEENPASIPELKTALKALHQHVKFYSSTTYLQPLILEDAWVAVGWSTDLVPVAQQYPNIETLVPRSGTALWADLWVKPSVSRSDRVSQSVIDNWIDFCWQEQTARQISRFTTATSPILLSLDRATLAAIAQKNPLALPEAETIDRSEFILPLSPESQQQYKALWKEIRAIN
ncbi:MAG: extracellular solute-binding protein, partial [Cyanobacteriota bacterium]|nr:extracellular solute-binding protein [Cyanobacteriota bacterium]